jgi:hypothetical protein
MKFKLQKKWRVKVSQFSLWLVAREGKHFMFGVTIECGLGNNSMGFPAGIRLTIDLFVFEIGGYAALYSCDEHIEAAIKYPTTR